jgi:hypothetical protein
MDQSFRQTSYLNTLGRRLMYHSMLTFVHWLTYLYKRQTSYLNTLGRRLMYHSMLTFVHWLTYLYK